MDLVHGWIKVKGHLGDHGHYALGLQHCWLTRSLFLFIFFICIVILILNRDLNCKQCLTNLCKIFNKLCKVCATAALN